MSYTTSSADVHAPPRAEYTSFYGRLPGAFAYPFSTDGLLMILFGGLFFWVGDLAAQFGIRTFLFAFVIWGYMCTFLVKVTHASGEGKDEMPNWPSITDGLVSTFFYLIGTILLSTLPIVLYGAACFFLHAPVKFIIIPVYMTLFFLPMALLRVAMFHTIEALNPFKIISSIFRVPTPYATVWLILFVILGVRVVTGLALYMVPFVGGVLSSIFGFYLLVVEMRILGLLYYAYEERLDWFSDI